ncbi:protein BIG GRAIN 1-like [Musa acuminata AAA Group]|uniref:protein BIG GRAIN 1-like n=1 Tax=Musa acuminata AAA Group TaxID=214697 RepID=UPI0031DB85C9
MMEGWERPPHRRSRSKNASFSSSLLDAIYRSIDDDVDNSKSGETRGGVPDRFFSHRKQVEPVSHSRNASRVPVVSELAVSGPGVTDYYRRSRCVVGTFAPTSSSSSSSSSITPRINATGLFSSSDGESNQSDRIPRPDSPATKKKAKPKCSNLRSGLRGLRKPRTASDAAVATSPRARLVRFIIALFSAAGSSRKPKIAVPSAAAAKDGARTEESTTTSTSASSCKGTCLSKASEASRRQAAGAEKGKRSVRFYPVNVIVDGDYSRPCGHKRLQDGAANAAARVKELLRPGGEEEEDDDGGSESSSDLFELENLTEVMGEGRVGGRCRDELPLYETTNLNKNRAIARGLIL